MPNNKKIKTLESYLKSKISTVNDVDNDQFLQASLHGRKENFSTHDYIYFLIKHVPGLSKYIITADDFAILTPPDIASAKTKDWAMIDKNHILRLLAKFKAKQVWMVESRDHQFHPLAEFNDPHKLDKKIYKKTHDYSLAVMTASVFQRALAEYPVFNQDKTTIKKTLNVLLNALGWLNANISDFNELYKKTLLKEFTSDLVQKKIRKKDIYHFVDTLSIHLNEEFRSLEALDDHALNGKQVPPDAVEIHIENRHSLGVLITTSSSGGCHKTIAANVFNDMKQANINVGVINESILTKEDVSSQFLGIAFSQLYTVVHQQHNLPEYRNNLVKLNNFLCFYVVDNRPALLRQAIKTVTDKYPVGSMYVTSHYEHNLRFLPSGAQIFYQVCDYGPIPEGLQNLADVASMHLPNTSLRFLVPSDSTQLINSVHKEQTEVFRKLSLPSAFPTAILDTTLADDLFNQTAADLGLSQTSDLIRCTIAMGGCGCSDLINHYADLIIKQSAKYPDAKLELCIVCGNNQDLVHELQQQYQHINLPENLNIKIVGMVPNAKFISLGKNSVLLTKPGGGTISECLQNGITALIHYDPKHSWELGNVKEVEDRGLGKRVVDETVLDDIIELSKKIHFIRRAENVIKKEKVSAYISNSLFTQNSAFTKSLPNLSAVLAPNERKPCP